MQAENEREKLIQQMVQAIYINSTTTVFFHTAVAEQIGLGATEEKTLLILSGLGPLTAGEIAQHTGLTTASVTSLIDRMEKKGFVHRIRDTTDRRKVIVEADKTRLDELMQVFGSLQGAFDELMDGFSNEQLATVTAFLNRATERSQVAIAALRQKLETKNTESGE